MKRYETYKDSGIQGVGEIPSHWDSNKLKFFADISTGTTPSTANEEYWNEATENWYTPADFNEGDIHLNGSSRKVSAMAFEKSACKVFKKNVVLVVGIGATLGKIGFSRVECSANQQINAIEFYDNVYPLFGAYYLSSLKEVMKSLASAATLAIMNQSVTGSIPFVCPTLTEQETIAAYLDRKVGQIDATIAEKEQMLEDLKNYRSAIISEAVTKGLDKNIEMKDRGIDKFPMIRSNWNTSKLKYIASIRSGSALPINNIKKDALYEVYGGNGCMGRADEYNTESPAIIIGRVGALCGNVHLIKTKKWVTDNALILNIKRDVTYEYLYYYLTAYDLNTLNSSNAQPLITGTKVLDVVTPMPSLNEQIMIANYLDDKTSMIDETINQISVQIVELKSYKSSLITEAVTGKIDLRDWKPKEENV